MSDAQGVAPQPRELWQRWRMAVLEHEGETADGGTAPDELTLAAYADGRLDEAEAAAVAAYLADHPELAADVEAARGAAGPIAAGDDATLAQMIARAAALVPGDGDRVLVFPGARRRPAWRAANWSALAASLLVVGYLGFAVGSDASRSLVALDPAGATAMADPVLDPPIGLFSGSAETGT